jgi:hydrogenase maturation protein HypF
MLSAAINAPKASSCGRLFDAVAAATGVAFERQAYEGQAGALLEAAVDLEALRSEGEELAYPFTLAGLGVDEAIPYVEPVLMWRALLRDLALGASAGIIAARFHRGLARAIGEMAGTLAGTEQERRFGTVALSGGCFQNRILFEETSRYLEGAGFQVLSHGDVPSNDGGLALGQAAVAAARLIAGRSAKHVEGGP